MMEIKKKITVKEFADHLVGNNRPLGFNILKKHAIIDEKDEK